MSARNKAMLVAGVAVGLLTASMTAHAQNFAGRAGAHQSRFDVEPHLSAGYGFDRGPGYDSGWGVGVRLGIPLMANGPVRTINNSLALSLGADIVWWTGRYRHDNVWTTSEVLIPLMVQWNFYVSPWFSLFPELGLALAFGGCDGCGFYPAPGFAVGGRVHFDGRAGYPALVFRVGFPTGFTLGVAF